MLEDFDPTAPFDEDEALFSSRFNDFERKQRKKAAAGEQRGRDRGVVVKKVKESYHIERAKREKEEELARVQKEIRQA